MKVNIVNKLRLPLVACGLMLIPPINSKPINDFYQNDSRPMIIAELEKDKFELNISPKGTNADSVLRYAPNSEVFIQDELKYAKIVIDLTKNLLYTYSDKGHAENAYLVATGKKSSPTHTGIRRVTHIETYPYKNAPEASKRRKNPNDYGPKIICLETIHPETGVCGITGEFIHGNNNPASLGKYASKGCIRMDNSVIKKLAKEVKRGDIVVIRNDLN